MRLLNLMGVLCVIDFGLGGKSYRDCDCPDIFLPVCGSDRKTYSCSCTAKCHGVSVVRKGPCQGYGGNDCAYNCDLGGNSVCGMNRISYANSCFSGCFGTQVYRNGQCPPIISSGGGCGSSVTLCCGADYRTYNSPCHASSAGVAVIHQGSCLLNGLYGMFGGSGNGYLSIYGSGGIGSSIIGLPNYITGSSLGLGMGLNSPFISGSGLFNNFFNFPIQNGCAPYVPYNYINSGYSSTGNMYCLPGLQYLPQMPNISPSFGFNSCPDPLSALQWMYPSGALNPFNANTFGLMPGYNGIGATTPYFNSFIGSNPLSYYQQPIAQTLGGLGTSSIAFGTQTQMISQPQYSQIVQPQYAQMAQPQFAQVAQTQMQVNPYASVNSNVQMAFPSVPQYAQVAQPQMQMGQPQYAQVAQPQMQMGQPQYAQVAQPQMQMSQPQYAQVAQPQMQMGFPTTFAGGLSVGSGRALSSTPTYQTASSSSTLSAIGGFIPADMMAKLARAPYVYYTYFYTIVYYKIARPETLVQGVAIKDIMYYISEYLIKMQPQQVAKSQVSVFEKSIGMEFDVSRSFDIVNDILNELQIGSGTVGAGPSLSQITQVSQSALPTSASQLPAATSAPLDIFGTAKPNYTLGSGLSR